MLIPRPLRLAWRRLARVAGRGDAGFTLIESIVSFVIFTVVAASASYGILKALNASHVSQQRVDAAAVAQYWVNDAIRQASTIAEIPAPGNTILSSVGDPNGTNGHYAEGEQFKAVETVVYDSGGSCNTGTMFTVSVVVSQQQTGQFLARSDARVACPHV
jgi:prepilin-type N-terminal cleavage/methylation domain-containing protein